VHLKINKKIFKISNIYYITKRLLKNQGIAKSIRDEPLEEITKSKSKTNEQLFKKKIPCTSKLIIEGYYKNNLKDRRDIIKIILRPYSKL
jgi:hypothetical protein